MCRICKHLDHIPIILALDENRTKTTRQQAFRFEPMWLGDAGFKEMVNESWRKVKITNLTLAGKLKACSKHIQKWNKECFGKVQKRLKDIKMELESLKVNPRTEQVARREARLAGELDEWMAREELLWKQRSRVDWLKEGEKQSLFF